MYISIYIYIYMHTHNTHEKIKVVENLTGIISIRDELGGGGPWPKGGDPNSKKNRLFWDIKLQIFGAEGAENFEKLRVLREKLSFFGVLWENLTKF